MMNQQRLFQFESRSTSRNYLSVAAAMALLLFGLAVFVANHFPINTTASMPIGIYGRVSHSIQRGSIVGACVPQPYAEIARRRGYLPFGTCHPGIHPVMKYVAGIPGDTIEVRSDGILVNGTAIPNTAPLRTDSLGRELPNQVGRHVLKQKEYWLASNRDLGSYDSRYFGPVTEILGAIEPLFTDEGPAEQQLRLEYQNIGGNTQ